MTSEALTASGVQSRQHEVRAALVEYGQVACGDRAPPAMPIWVAALIVLCTTMALALVFPSLL